MTYLCADIGTSSLKAAFIDADGVESAFVRVVYRQRGEARAPYAGTVTAYDWKAAFKEAVSSLLRQKPAVIAAICVSANGPTLTPVDREGNPFPPLPWYAVPQSKHTGQSLFLPHLERYIAEDRARYDKTARIFSCQEWLAGELGAEPVTVLPNERYQPYYWEEGQCGAIGCDPRKLPPFVPLGAVIGKTDKKAERDFALPQNIPLVAGGPDFIMALIGTGVLAEGLVCDRAGTSEGINVCSRVPANGDARLRTLPHIVENHFNIAALLPHSGVLFDNYRRETGQENRCYAEHLAALLHSASVAGEDIAGRQVLLRIAREVREKIIVLRENGFNVTEMRVSGGQAKNPLWNTMKAKITGVTLAIPAITDGELAGNACLCAVALGEAAGLEEAARRIVHIKERFSP